MANERRRKPRHRAAHWTGRYRFGGASAWRDCALVDISQTGAGFDAYLLPTDAAPMHEVELELVDRADPAPDPIRLAGTVRHLTRSPQGHVRVGMEFVALSQLEGRLLAMLFRRDERRHPQRPSARARPASGAAGAS
jgi:hypothetical protein